eukprot:scaffold129836_cov60-Phaeocystis_antarctica.AAC.1
MGPKARAKALMRRPRRAQTATAGALGAGEARDEITVRGQRPALERGPARCSARSGLRLGLGLGLGLAKGCRGRGAPLPPPPAPRWAAAPPG